MSETIIKRSGNATDRKQANKALGTVGALQGEYKTCKENVRASQENLETQKSRLKLSEDKLSEKRDALCEIQEIIDSDYLPEGAQPVGRIEARDRLKLEIGHLEAIVAAQLKTVNEAREQLRIAEKKMFLADQQLNKFVDTIEDSQIILKAQADMDAERAHRLAAAEEARAKRRERENKEAIAARASQLAELESLAQTQVQVAKEAHKHTSERVASTTKKTRAMVDRLEKFQEEEWKDRAEAVLELRTNQNAVRAKAATDSANHNRKIKEQKKKLEDEKGAMIAKGLNPYAEFRRREIDAEDAKKEKAIKKSVELNKAALAERLIREEETQRKAEAAERREKAFEKKHRDELGSHIIEERNREYLRSVTTDGVEMLDPTGRAARIDPSKITDIPDYSFGLGKSSRIPPASMKRIVEKIRGDLKVDREELGEYTRLVRSQSAHDGDKSKPAASTASVDSYDDSLTVDNRKISEFKELAPKNGAIPGAEGLASTINMAEEGDVEQLIRIVGDDNGTQDVETVGLGLGSSGTAKYKTTQLTKFEQDAFDRAKVRQKKRVEEGTIQIAGGREFKGQAFVASPDVIEFIDFQVGRVYRKRFTLTNTSYTFNSFRILPLADDVIDFFDITFDKPGRMSAGVSCSIDVKFVPKLNQDIFSHIEFYSETGPVKVPLKCLIRRCRPEIINPEIDFGSIVIGQQARIPLKFKNVGAIGSRFTVTRIDESDDDSAAIDPERNSEEDGETDVKSRKYSENRGVNVGQASDDEMEAALNMGELVSRVQRRMQEDVQRKLKENPHPLCVEQTEGIVDGYGEASVSVLCSPLYVGGIKQKFLVTFEDVDESLQSVDSAGNYVRKEQYVSTFCSAEELPIYLANEDVNMKCTLHGRIYRKKFELCNRSNNTCAVSIKIPAPYNHFIEVNPTTVYVQSGLSQAVNAKFAPDPTIIEKLKYYSVLHEETEDAASLIIPVEIRVANQELPVFFLLKTDVCSSVVRLSHSSLDFGRVYVYQQKTLQLNAKNISMLPQKVAFTNLRKEISVQPNDGFAVLLPNEEVVFDVSLRPLSAVTYNMNVTLTTSFNDTYVIKAHGVGVESPVILDNPVIHMRPSVPGEKIIENAVVRNNTKSKQVVEVVTPDSKFSWLKISPTVVELPPNSAARLEVEYFPPIDISDDDPIEWHQKLVNERRAQEDDNAVITTPFSEWVEEDGWAYGSGQFGSIQWTKKNWTNSEDDSGSVHGVGADEWGIVGNFHIPIFMKPSSIGAITDENRDEMIKQLQPPLYLCLDTVVVKPEFIADTTFMDFGQMAVGTRVVKTIKVRNMSLNRDMSLRTLGLNAVGPFSVINANRTMYPSQWHTLVIECKPMLQGLVVEVLELSSTDGGPRINITLRVQGVNPTVEIGGLDPAQPGWSPLGGIISFGNIVPNDIRTKKFTIQNKSLFTIEASIQRAICANVPPAKQAEFLQRTASGLPLFSCRPEFAVIPEGETVEVEVTFRPDRARLFPYREDFNILVGKGDDPIKICATGRTVFRQMFVRPIDPTDEPFYNDAISDERDEDLLLTHASEKVRSLARETAFDLGVGVSKMPVLQLKYPDPFINDDGDEEQKSQTRQLAICCAEILDGRTNSSAGSFEFQLSDEAKQSNYFSCTNDKGNVNIGGEVVMSVTCTLPRPKGLGGLEVGSWQTFDSTLSLKGGWKADGESSDVTVPVSLSAYVRL